MVVAVNICKYILQRSVSFAVPLCIHIRPASHACTTIHCSVHRSPCHLVKDCQSGLVKVGAAKQSKISVSTSLT